MPRGRSAAQLRELRRKYKLGEFGCGQRSKKRAARKPSQVRRTVKKRKSTSGPVRSPSSLTLDPFSIK